MLSKILRPRMHRCHISNIANHLLKKNQIKSISRIFPIIAIQCIQYCQLEFNKSLTSYGTLELEFHFNKYQKHSFYRNQTSQYFTRQLDLNLKS